MYGYFSFNARYFTKEIGLERDKNMRKRERRRGKGERKKERKQSE